MICVWRARAENVPWVISRRLWVKSRHSARKKSCPLYPRKRTFHRAIEVPWALTYATFSAVQLLQKCLSELRSQVIGAQLGFSTGAIRKSDVNDPGGNSVAAANFVAVFIGAVDVDFSGSNHFGLRDRNYLGAEPRSRVGRRSNVCCCDGFGSKAGMCSAPRDVRFAPRSGHTRYSGVSQLKSEGA